MSTSPSPAPVVFLPSPSVTSPILNNASFIVCVDWPFKRWKRRGRTSQILLRSEHMSGKIGAEKQSSCHAGHHELTAPDLKSDTVYPADSAVPRGDSRWDMKGTSWDALIEDEPQCWKTRIRYVLFDAVDLLPHPPPLGLGSWGFVVRDYSGPQRQLLKQPNMQICPVTRTEIRPTGWRRPWRDRWILEHCIQFSK